MANTRIKDLSNTATNVASDAFIAIDGSANGTEKISRDNLRQDTADALAAAPSTYNLAPLTSGSVDVDKGGTGSTTVAGAKTNLEIPNVGTAANEVSVNGMLGDLAFQSSEGPSVGALKADYGTATSGTGTAVSGVFNAYERGTFTPTIYYQNPTGLSTSYTTQSGNYVRTGDLISIQIKLTWTVTGTPVNDNLGVRGIPFQPAREASMMCHDSAGQSSFVISNAVNDILICKSSSLASNLADNVGTGTHTIYISGTYQIA